MTRRKTVSKILQLKEFDKERLESEVRTARERLYFEQEKLTVLETAYRRTNADFTARQMSGTVPVHEVDLFFTYLKHVGKQIEHQKGIIALRAAELQKKQTAMVEVYKEQRLFEILHDKIVHEQIKEADRSEQKETDFDFLSRKAKR